MPVLNFEVVTILAAVSRGLLRMLVMFMVQSSARDLIRLYSLYHISLVAGSGPTKFSSARDVGCIGDCNTMERTDNKIYST